MKRFKLTKEEQEISDYIDKGKYKSLLTPQLKKYYQEAAKYSIKLRKSKVKKDKESSFKTPAA